LLTEPEVLTRWMPDMKIANDLRDLHREALQ
jgi:hypothetical protein